MGASPTRWHLLTLFLFGCSIHVRSERPQSQNTDGDSLIEVSAHHLTLAATPPENPSEPQSLQRGDTVEVLESFEGDNEQDTKQTLPKGLIGKVRDIDEDGDASMDFFPEGGKGEVFHQWVFQPNVQKLGKTNKKATKLEAMAPTSAIQVSSPDEDFDDFEDVAAPTATRRTFNLDGETKPESFQVPGHDAQHRSSGLDPDTFSTGDSHLDRLGETDTPGTFFLSHAEPQHPRPLISLDPEHDINPTNALFVPDEPEKSHIETDMLGGDEANKRYSHFQELLNLKPAVMEAIDIYRKDLNKHRVTASGLAKKTEFAVKKEQELNGGLKQAQEATAGASKESEKETRKLGVDSLEDFGMYNKHGVFGKDKKGEWSPDAGKWSIFKSITSNAKDLKMADMKWENFKSFLGSHNDVFPPVSIDGAEETQTQHNLPPLGEGGVAETEEGGVAETEMQHNSQEGGVAETEMQHDSQEDHERKTQPVAQENEKANEVTEHGNPFPLVDLPNVDAHEGSPNVDAHEGSGQTEHGNPFPLVDLPNVEAHVGSGHKAPAPSIAPAHTEQGNPTHLIPVPGHKM